MTAGIRVRRGLLFLLPGAALSTALACSVAVNLDNLSGGQPARDAGVDDGGDASVGCVSATFPAAPEGAAAGGDIEFVVAVREVDFGENAGLDEPVGLDVDGVCTCSPGGGSCAYPAWATEIHCDLKGGIDNASGKLFKNITALVGGAAFGSGHYSTTASEGRWSLLLRVTGYNGEKDDEKVTLSIYTGGAMPAPGGPAWNGADEWPVSSASLVDGADINKPVQVDADAYVSGGILVAHVEGARIDLVGDNGPLGVRLTGGTLAAPLGKDESGGFRIEGGTVAARWRWADFFEALGSAALGGSPTCAGSSLYSQIQKRVCASVDIASTAGGETADCDAISFGMKFTALPAKLGAVYPAPGPVAQCAAGTEPVNNACDKLAAPP